MSTGHTPWTMLDGISNIQAALAEQLYKLYLWDPKDATEKQALQAVLDTMSGCYCKVFAAREKLDEGRKNKCQS